ncbi:MAG TPA: GNAT family N-acetyltransferase [Devosiaceae bacterium]|nr:GNAT family N-acetyltransferase [Devosiaceae bacterium]
MTEHLLDNAPWHALTGPQSYLALGAGEVRRFNPEFAPFGGMETISDGNRAALAALLPEEGVAVLFTTAPVELPAGLELVLAGQLSQMLAANLRASEGGAEIVALSPADVPAMRELVALTEPGPFAPRTNELGQYFGIKDGDRLVAMAGERLHPPGFTEVSAVCTHPDYRGRGYAKALVSRVASVIASRGDVPFLHVYPHNKPAVATYQQVGFVERRLIELTVFRRPKGAIPSG